MLCSGMETGVVEIKVEIPERGLQNSSDGGACWEAMVTGGHVPWQLMFHKNRQGIVTSM